MTVQALLTIRLHKLDVLGPLDIIVDSNCSVRPVRGTARDLGKFIPNAWPSAVLVNLINNIEREKEGDQKESSTAGDVDEKPQRRTEPSI